MPKPTKPTQAPLGNIAVLIDFENINDTDMVERIYQLCATRGRVVCKKAVADWSGDTKTVQRALVATGTELVHQFSAGKGKNSSDVRLVIEAMDLLHDPRKQFDTFVFATSDGDFVPIVERLRSEGKHVTIIPGPAPISTTLVQAADELIDGLVPTVAKTIQAADRGFDEVEREIPLAVRLAILAAFDAVQFDTKKSIVNSNTMIQRVRRKRPNFSYKDYGYPSFKAMLRDIPQLVGEEGRPGPYMVSRR